MGNKSYYIFEFVGVILIGWIVNLQTQINYLTPKKKRHTNDFRTENRNDTSCAKWNKLIKAIIQVESEGKIDTVNDFSGATGILQEMKVYVKDANRIIGKKKYHQNDRKDSLKSIEMFNIIQNHYNPHHDIEKAIELHNPNGGYEYKLKVMNEYVKLLNM